MLDTNGPFVILNKMKPIKPDHILNVLVAFQPQSNRIVSVNFYILIKLRF